MSGSSDGFTKTSPWATTSFPVPPGARLPIACMSVVSVAPRSWFPTP